MHRSVGFFEGLDETLERVRKPGLILSTGAQGNPMTIGWATVGVIWGRPILTVLVRPSRHSFSLLRDRGEFCVNVLPDGWNKQVGLCGAKSGRDTDKVSLCGFNMQPGERVGVPWIGQSLMHYECRVVHSSHVLDAELNSEIRDRFYPHGDLHQIWHGEILGVWRADAE